jgi:N-methylhydantoinase A
LELRARDALQVEGVPPEAILLKPQVDLRYRGQSYELSLVFGPGYLAEFHRLHHFTYGYSAPEAPVELVNLRLRAVGRVSPPRLAAGREGGPDPAAASCGLRLVSFDVGALESACYLGERLLAGNHIDGPALVVRPDTTILLDPDDAADVDQHGNLVVLVGAVSASPKFARHA